MTRDAHAKVAATPFQELQTEMWDLRAQQLNEQQKLREAQTDVRQKFLLKVESTVGMTPTWLKWFRRTLCYSE